MSTDRGNGEKYNLEKKIKINNVIRSDVETGDGEIALPPRLAAPFVQREAIFPH